MAFATNDGEVVFNPFPTDMDWTATCSGGGGDTEAPVMTSASVSSTTHNSAVVAVTATDNKGVTAYVVKNGDAEVGTYTPSNNTITITGLSASSTYNYTVYAKDAAGNVSASGINIKITTTAAPVGPVSNYCREELTAKNDANAKILLTCTKVSEGNYRIVIEGSNLSGLGGSYYNPGAVELRTKITSSTSTKIICDIPAASDPSLYTPLYVIMSGEKEFTWPKDITWGTCPSTPVSSVSLDKHQQELDNGGKIVLYTTVLPDGATNKDINWTSSNTSVATVDANGVVTGVANGTAIITATSDADHTKSDQCTVTVVDKKTRDYWGEFTYTDSHSREITVTYRISRNTDNTLEFYMSVDQDISDLVPDINVQITAGGATQEQVHLSYNASSRIGTGISTGTYNDASNYNIEFYLASTNSGLHRENVPYTVGSSSISPCGTCFKVTF